jgi:membrane dipeptidase
MISHSHLARGEDSHPRLLSRDHALAVARAGGLIGAWPAGVALESFDDYVDEILRMVELLGAEHVSIGTDMDANYQPVMSSYLEMPNLAASLRERGLGESETALVMGGNFLRLFEDVAGG